MSNKQHSSETPYNTRHNTLLHAVPCNLSRDHPPSSPTPGGITALRTRGVLPVGHTARPISPTNNLVKRSNSDMIYFCAGGEGEDTRWEQVARGRSLSLMRVNPDSLTH